MSAYYGYAGVFFLGGLAFVGFNFLLASFVTRLIRSHNPHQSKQLSYECGEAPTTEAWVQYNARYYLFAMMFVLFDVETVFLVPWAVGFKELFLELGWTAVGTVGFFLAVLILGFVYDWKKGAFEWA